MNRRVPAIRAFVAELRRRRVVKVALVYAAVAFVVWQAADIAFPALQLPTWTMTLVVVLALLGFPFALVFAWIFDVTPEGVRRTAQETDPAGTRKATTDSLRTGDSPWTAQRLAAVGGVALFAMLVGGFVSFGGPFRGGSIPDAASGTEAAMDRSVAVLPFSNLSTDQENEHFSDGMTEDILGRLHRIEGLRVPSRTSVMSYKGSPKGLAEIAAELGVAHVLEGSVRRDAGRLRITVALVEARTDRNLWSEVYDRELTDIFAIQSEIAEQIASALRLQLSPGDRTALALGGTTNVEAYDLYLRGVQIWDAPEALGLEDFRAADYASIAFFRQALALDPDYALPYARLARSYLWHMDLPREVRHDSALVFSRRAIELAPELPHGYAALGLLRFHEGDHATAASDFERALELDPEHLEAHMGLSRYHEVRRDLVRALAHARRAAAAAPGDPGPAALAARHLQHLGAWDAAEAWLRQAYFNGPNPLQGHCRLASLAADRGDSLAVRREIEAVFSAAPDASFGWQCTGEMELWLGNPEAALAHLDRVAGSLVPGPGNISDRSWNRLLRGVAELGMGERGRAAELLVEAETLSRAFAAECAGRCGNYSLAAIVLHQGRTEEALEFLERAVETGWAGIYATEGALRYLFAPLEGEPRYYRLLADLREELDRQRASIPA